ncbi:MAG: hypothetical protein WBL06_07210 [Pseudolysinimonas sp.]|uniref:hypothetical protein n=1 Tax=Pseudolysinimonas sp. TaxID=2680009 RepID=UPI003C71C70F
MTTTTPATEPATALARFKVFAATALLVAAATGAAQFVAISLFGMADFVRLEAGTGPGLLALVSGLVMAARVKDWDGWRRWIWLPIVIAVTAVFILNGVVSQSIAAEKAAEQEQLQVCADLETQLNAKAAEIQRLESPPPVPTDPNAPSWETTDTSGVTWANPELDQARIVYGNLLDSYERTC